MKYSSVHGAIVLGFGIRFAASDKVSSEFGRSVSPGLRRLRGIEGPGSGLNLVEPMATDLSKILQLEEDEQVFELFTLSMSMSVGFEPAPAPAPPESPESSPEQEEPPIVISNPEPPESSPETPGTTGPIIISVPNQDTAPPTKDPATTTTSELPDTESENAGDGNSFPESSASISSSRLVIVGTVLAASIGGILGTI